MSGAALRRLIHAATAAVVLIHLWISLVAFRATVIGMALLVVAVDVTRLAHAPFDAWVRRTIPVFRSREARRVSGASWLWLGYAAAVSLPPRAAVAGIVVAALADPVASLVGGRFGRAGRKTWIGSSAMLAVALVLLAVMRLGWGTVLMAGLAAAIVERWPGRVDDNLLIPPVVAAVVTMTA